MDLSSLTIATGSGHSLLSKLQSPRCSQWKKSLTITAKGTPLRWYSRATARSSSWVR